MTGLRHNPIKTQANIYQRPVRCSVWLCLVETDALFGKTEGLFRKTDIGYEVSIMYMFCIKFSNRYSGPKKLDKTGFLTCHGKKKVFGEANICLKHLKTLSLCYCQKQCTMSVPAPVLLNRVTVSSKQKLTLAKKDLCLYQTEPLFEPNRA